MAPSQNKTNGSSVIKAQRRERGGSHKVSGCVLVMKHIHLFLVERQQR